MEDTQPYYIFGPQRPGPWVITVDHASNRVPDWVNGGDLGLPAEDMARHIAFDIGALGVAQKLGESLNSPVIASNFSRLVIDPNRGLDDPTLLMKVYDGTIIPANHPMCDTDRNRRIKDLYLPYHDALETLMGSRDNPALLAIHSFTPQLTGRPKRPWEVGILFASDQRLSTSLLDELSREKMCVGANEPYNGHLPGDSVDQHALRKGHLNALIEVRNDLIETEQGQADWANRLGPALTNSLENHV